MGYATRVCGVLTLTPLPSVADPEVAMRDVFDVLKCLSNRRMLCTDVEAKDGDWDAILAELATPCFSPQLQGSLLILNNNKQPLMQPSLNCPVALQWHCAPDGRMSHSLRIISDQPYYCWGWLQYIICRVLEPQGFLANGQFLYQGDDVLDRGRVVSEPVDVGLPQFPGVHVVDLCCLWLLPHQTTQLVRNVMRAISPAGELAEVILDGTSLQSQTLEALLPGWQRKGLSLSVEGCGGLMSGVAMAAVDRALEFLSNRRMLCTDVEAKDGDWDAILAELATPSSSPQLQGSLLLLNSNRQPLMQPSLWCPVVLQWSSDHSGTMSPSLRIISEKPCWEWLQYIICRVLEPQGVVANEDVLWTIFEYLGCTHSASSEPVDLGLPQFPGVHVVDLCCLWLLPHQTTQLVRNVMRAISPAGELAEVILDGTSLQSQTLEALLPGWQRKGLSLSVEGCGGLMSGGKAFGWDCNSGVSHCGNSFSFDEYGSEMAT
eukprot:m51a1_g14610 hypothetical protein (489) ;mRNA; f:1202298-1207561